MKFRNTQQHLYRKDNIKKKTKNKNILIKNKIEIGASGNLQFRTYLIAIFRDS